MYTDTEQYDEEPVNPRGEKRTRSSLWNCTIVKSHMLRLLRKLTYLCEVKNITLLTLQLNNLPDNTILFLE